MKGKKSLPDSPADWLRELAEAYMDAQEAIPFGKMTGDEFGEESLFHLAPAVCLKFRGYKPKGKKLKKATEAALSSYVASQEISGDLFDTPQVAFAFCYLAAHFGLDLIDEAALNTVMEYVDSEKDTLVQFTESN